MAVEHSKMQRKLTVWFKPSVIQCFMKALHNPLILKSPYMYSAVFNNPENFYNTLKQYSYIISGLGDRSIASNLGCKAT